MKIEFYWIHNHPVRKLAYDFSPILNVANYINGPSDLDHIYTTRINPTWPWCFMYLCIMSLICIFLRTFSCMFINDSSVWFLSLYCLFFKVTFFCYLFFKLNLFIYLFLAALGLRCCARAFSSCGEWGLLFVAVHGLLIAVASLVAKHGL